MIKREQVHFELNVQACDPGDVLAAVTNLINSSTVPAKITGTFAGGTQEYGAPSGLQDLENGRLFDQLRVDFLTPLDGAWGGRLKLEFTGTPTVADGQITLANYACHHIEGSLLFETDSATAAAAWDWLWYAYLELMSLTPLPQPWSYPTSQHAGGILFDQPGTAGTMTHRIPANVFTKSRASTTDVHHYGPIVHLSPSVINSIGHPEDQPSLAPLRVQPLSDRSANHGTIVQMPWPIEESNLKAWRDYLWPVLGIGHDPTPETLKILDADYLFPIIPLDVSEKFVLEDDVSHHAFDAYPVADDAAAQPGTFVRLTEYSQFNRGPAPIVNTRFTRRLPRRLNEMRNVFSFANPEAMTTPATGLIFIAATQHGDSNICQTDSGAEIILRNLISQDPKVFAPALLWQRDRTEHRSVKSDSWTLSLLTYDDEIGEVTVLESVIVSGTRKGKLRMKSVGDLTPTESLARLTTTASGLFDTAVASPPDPARWKSIYDSRIDIERWLRLPYHSLSLDERLHNNEMDLAWHSSEDHRFILANPITPRSLSD